MSKLPSTDVKGTITVISTDTNGKAQHKTQVILQHTLQHSRLMGKSWLAKLKAIACEGLLKKGQK